MYKAIIIMLAVLVLSPGCTTTGFIGLAKESYAIQLGEENEQLKAENEQLKEDLKAIQKDVEKVLELANDIQDLEELTKTVESKLDKLPEATLRKIISILQKYLDEKDKDEE